MGAAIIAPSAIAALAERWNGLEVLVRGRRQAALAVTAIILAQMGKIALARIAGDRTTDRCLARGQCRGKKPGIRPNKFLQRRLRARRSVACSHPADRLVMGKPPAASVLEPGPCSRRGKRERSCTFPERLTSAPLDVAARPLSCSRLRLPTFDCLAKGTHDLRLCGEPADAAIPSTHP
jgi:hypothetical protein